MPIKKFDEFIWLDGQILKWDFTKLIDDINTLAEQIEELQKWKEHMIQKAGDNIDDLDIRTQHNEEDIEDLQKFKEDATRHMGNIRDICGNIEVKIKDLKSK